MTDVQEIARLSEGATTAFLKELLDSPHGGNVSAITTGALYAVLRLICAARPKAMETEKWRGSVVMSVRGALEQYVPTDGIGYAATGSETDFLELVATTANGAVQDLADTIHSRSVGGPCCPMSGIVPGLFAGALFVAADNRDRAQFPLPSDLRPMLEELMAVTLSDAAQHEATDAMGEVQGHG